MRKVRNLFVLTLLLGISIGISACGKKPVVDEGFAVTFSVDGTTWKTVEGIQRGSRITKPSETPESSDEENVFKGWFQNSDGTNLWNFDLNIVSKNITLYAGFEKIGNVPVSLSMAEEVFTSSLSWKQRTMSDNYEVTLYPKIGKAYATTGVVVSGSTSFNSDSFIVTFTPEVVPVGGFYKVTLKDITNDTDLITVEELLFGGEGTEANPFRIGTEKEWKEISTDNSYDSTGKYYQLLSNISVTSLRNETDGVTFNGFLNGNNKTITHTSSNAGLFFKVGKQANVKNLEVAGDVSTSSWSSVGGLVDFNSGLIENVIITAAITSTSGAIGKAEDILLGGAGGAVGTNEVDGIIKNVSLISSNKDTGKVLASISGGGIVGINRGLITESTNKGFIGGNNELHSAKSTSRYSYIGGIAAINFGTIEKSRTTGQGRVLAQRQLTVNASTTNTENQGFNFAAGGITAWNQKDASIKESYFDGIRVYADQAVGGIAGINDGLIQNAFSGGMYNEVYYQAINATEVVGIPSYIGGRIEVGGIAGRVGSTSVITNVYSTANVHSFASPGYAIAEKADNAVYFATVSNDPYWSADDAGSNATVQEYLSSDSLITPVGLNNVLVENTKTNLKEDFVLGETYLTTLGELFYFDTVLGVRLAYELTIVEVNNVVDVYLNIDGVESYAGQVESLTLNTLEGNVKVLAVTSKYFKGWATEENGEVVFTTETISYNDIKDYQLDKEVTLYAVYGDLVKTNEITIYYWTTYVSPDIQAVMDQAFKDYLTAQGFSNVSEVVITNKEDAGKVADFGAVVNADSSASILLGVGANIQTSGKVDYIERVSGFVMKKDAVDTNSRQIARLQNTDLAVAFMEFVQTEAGLNALLGIN